MDKTQNTGKYGEIGDLELEKRTIEIFESVKNKSLTNLRSSQKRILVGFVISLCLTLILGAFSFATSWKSTKDLEYMFEEPLQARYYAFTLNIDVLRSYVTTLDIALCGVEDRVRIGEIIGLSGEIVSDVQNEFAMLKELTHDDEVFKVKLDELEALLSLWYEAHEKSLNFARAGDFDACQKNVTTVEDTLVADIRNVATSITDIAADYALESYNNTLARSKGFDAASISMTLLIAFMIVLVMLYVKRLTDRAVAMTEKAQREQNEVLDELMVMDETLRQNLAQMEIEGEAMRKVKEKFSNSLEAANDVIWEINFDTGEFFASEKWEEITGYPKLPWFDLARIEKMIVPEDIHLVKEVFDNNEGYFNIQIRVFDPEGKQKWLNIRGKWLESKRVTGSISDITQAKQNEQIIKYMAYHDAITNLPNRANFIQELESELMKKGGRGSILFIDLDNFKIVNDSHGHDFGDKLLLEVGKRIESAIGKDALAARFGGDEYLVLLRGIFKREQVMEKINLITGALDEPVSIEDNLFYVTASIGVSVYPDDGATVSQLLKNSDAAMYESKYAGRNTFAFYNQEMSNKVLRTAEISDILRNAVENDSMYMLYQPQYNSKTGMVQSCEALMRMKDSGTGMISPVEFIPIAEETRLIIPLGYKAIRDVIETDLYLRAQGTTLESFSVNISEIQLREPDFIDKVKDIIEEYSYDASRLHFEITESILLSNIDEKIDVFNAIRELGIKIELDDFGTGYSSLNYVRSVPLDVLKIDKCFIDEIGVSSEKENLIDLIIRLAEMVDANVVAEGVETLEQVEFLHSRGEILIQGYYYSVPLAKDRLPEKISELNNLSSTN